MKPVRQTLDKGKERYSVLFLFEFIVYEILKSLSNSMKLNALDKKLKKKKDGVRVEVRE